MTSDFSLRPGSSHKERNQADHHARVVKSWLPTGIEEVQIPGRNEHTK